MIQRVFKPIQLLVKNVEDSEARENLKNIFTELEVVRTTEVEQNRKAQAIQLKAQCDALQAAAAAVAAKTQAELLQLRLLDAASKSFDLVAQETQWVAFRNKDGEIVLESVFTRRDQRNALRVEKAHLESAVGDGDYSGMFEAGSENKDDEKKIGFGSSNQEE